MSEQPIEFVPDPDPDNETHPPADEYADPEDFPEEVAE